MRFIKLAAAVTAMSAPMSLTGVTPTLPLDRIETIGIIGAFGNETNCNFDFRVYVSEGKYLLDLQMTDLTNKYKFVNNGISFTSTGRNNPVDLTYTIDLLSNMGPKGISVVASIYQNYNIYSTSFTLLPKVVSSIVSTEYKNKPYEINGTTLLINRSGVPQYPTEYFSFKDTVDYLTVTEDNILDLSEITFEHPEEFALKNTNTGHYLKIKDVNNLFPYMDKNADDIISIPLKITKEGSYVYMSFRDQMYVNKKTLQMSFRRRTGYTVTRDFYINPDIIPQIGENDIWIELSKVGQNDTDIIIPLHFPVDKNFIGMCFDSQYCFTGGIKQ